MPGWHMEGYVLSGEIGFIEWKYCHDQRGKLTDKYKTEDITFNDSNFHGEW